MPFDQGAPQFGLNDAKIAKWNSAGSYGTLTDVMSIQMGTVTKKVVSAILTGDDRETAIASMVIGGTVQMRFGGLNLSSYAVLTGKSIGVISSVSQLYLTGGDVMPYIGIILKVNSAETGDTWFFMPKCKIVSDYTIAQAEYGTFTIPEVTLEVVDDASYGVINVITHPTGLDITVMPPANIATVV